MSEFPTLQMERLTIHISSVANFDDIGKNFFQIESFKLLQLAKLIFTISMNDYGWCMNKETLQKSVWKLKIVVQLILNKKAVLRI